MSSIITIILFSCAFCGLLWLLDRACAEENAERKRELRAMQRVDVIAENRRWYIETREADHRADLVRGWEELDI